jgi:hypothetical protein
MDAKYSPGGEDPRSGRLIWYATGQSIHQVFETLVRLYGEIYPEHAIISCVSTHPVRKTPDSG